MVYKFRAFEDYGVYISMCTSNLDDKIHWFFQLYVDGEHIFKSGSYISFDDAERQALIKAVEYI